MKDKHNRNYFLLQEGVFVPSEPLNVASYDTFPV